MTWGCSESFPGDMMGSTRKAPGKAPHGMRQKAEAFQATMKSRRIAERETAMVCVFVFPED
jgi:hypothetical protein